MIGPQFAGGFVARDLGDEGPDEARRFDFAMTFDRELVTAAAAILMHQVGPSADVLSEALALPPVQPKRGIR